MGCPSKRGALPPLKHFPNSSLKSFLGDEQFDPPFITPFHFRAQTELRSNHFHVSVMAHINEKRPTVHDRSEGIIMRVLIGTSTLIGSVQNRMPPD